jgi:hypothetical protein
MQVVEAVRQALQEVRAALVELYGSIGADPSAPQEVWRRYGINRVTTWKLARAIGAPDSIASLVHLPGQPGLEIVVTAFEAAGAPREVVARIRSAIEEFARVVEAGAGDREQLEMMLESMGLLERESGSCRELAYRGNSSIWGAQARTRASVAFISPSSLAPDTLDAVHISGLVGVRRLRPNARCQLLVQRSIDQAASPAFTVEDVCPGSEGGYMPQLLTEFCSPNMPALSFESFSGGRHVLVPDGQVGACATFDCYNGTIVRGLSAHRTPGSEYGLFYIANLMPAEMLVFDLIFHRTLAIGDAVEALLYGSPRMSPARVMALDHDPPQENQLPMSERPFELAGTPSALLTSRAPALTRIVECVYKRMGWNPREFQALRLQLPYPPMSSSVVMRWQLPHKSATGGGVRSSLRRDETADCA